MPVFLSTTVIAEVAQDFAASKIVLGGSFESGLTRGAKFSSSSKVLGAMAAQVPQEIQRERSIFIIKPLVS